MRSSPLTSSPSTPHSTDSSGHYGVPSRLFFTLGEVAVRNEAASLGLPCAFVSLRTIVMKRIHVLTVLALSAIGGLLMLGWSEAGQEPPPSQDQQVRDLRQRVEMLEARVRELEGRSPRDQELRDLRQRVEKLEGRVVDLAGRSPQDPEKSDKRTEWSLAPIGQTLVKTPIEAEDVGVLSGKVTFEGKPPVRKDLTDIMRIHADANCCLGGDTKDPLWIVDADGGIANVVVWLKPPDGKFFRSPVFTPDDVKKVVMDQPNCAFEPHVTAFQPTFYDRVSNRQRKTGQIFEVRNSAPINHNVGWYGNRLFNSGASWIVPPKGSAVINAVPCKPDVAGKEDLLSISCDIHKWMSAKVAVFDHPYFAVTNTKGEFEIKRIPANTNLTLAVWHESMDPTSLKGARTQPLLLKPGNNIKEIKLH